MKKTLSSIISLAIFVSLSISALGASSTITITNGDAKAKPVTYTYSSDKAEEMAKSIKDLITLSDLSKEKEITQALTITSDSYAGKPVSVKLRLSDTKKATPKPEATMTPTERDALGYYIITVTDADGEIVYSEDDGDYQNGSRDILLGTFNKLSATESKTFILTISTIKDAKSSVRNAAEALDWSIVSDAYIPTDSVTPQPTATVQPVQTPVATAAAKVNTDKNGTIALAAGEYTCGEDIKAGRYVVSGNGKVKVYGADGTVKTTVALKNKGDNTSGVEEYIVQLSEGEKISTDSDITLKPHTQTTATATPKPTTSPKATATPKATTTPSKTNPKTGDTAPIALVLLTGALSISAVVFMEIKKRRDY